MYSGWVFQYICVRIFSDFYDRTSGLTYLGHDDGGGHAPPLSAISKKRGVAGGGEKLAIPEAKEVKLVDSVIHLSGECRLGKKRLRKLQGSLHDGALQETKT